MFASQSSALFKPGMLEQDKDPASGCCFPGGHSWHETLGSFSCGWYHALGQLSHSFAPSDEAYFPFAQFMHDMEPPKLVCPCGQKSHFVLSSLPFVPGGHAFVSLQMPLAKSHSLADQPGAFC
jgi:hypothetical protein